MSLWPFGWARTRRVTRSRRRQAVPQAVEGVGPETLPVIARLGKPALTLQRLAWRDVAGRRRPAWREDQRRTAATPQRGTAPPRATDSRITPTLRLRRAARTCQGRPPHRGEGHGQKERQEGAVGQEGAEGQDDPEEAVRAGRPDHSCDDRRSVRESASQEEVVGRLGHASERTMGAEPRKPKDTWASPHEIIGRSLACP